MFVFANVTGYAEKTAVTALGGNCVKNERIPVRRVSCFFRDAAGRNRAYLAGAADVAI